jgi:hypothetical protein
MSTRGSRHPPKHLLIAVFLALLLGVGCDDQNPTHELVHVLEAEPQPMGTAEHTGAPDRAFPEPIIRSFDEDYIEAEAEAARTRMTEHASAAHWIYRFRQQASGASSVIRAEPLQEVPSSTDGDGEWHESTWHVHEIVGGEPVPTEIVLVQESRDGKLPLCGALRGFPGRRDLLIVDRLGDDKYALIHDGISSYSFFIDAGERRYQVDSGPFIDGPALHEEAQQW